MILARFGVSESCRRVTPENDFNRLAAERHQESNIAAIEVRSQIAGRADYRQRLAAFFGHPLLDSVHSQTADHIEAACCYPINSIPWPAEVVLFRRSKALSVTIWGKKQGVRSRLAPTV